MKKGIMISMCMLITLAIIFAVQTIQPTKAANIVEESASIKVFIGNTETMTAAEAKKYNQSQAEQLTRLVQEKPNEVGSVLITFEDFLTVEEVNEKIGSVEKIIKVYIWMPGKDGRSIIYVKDNNIGETIQEFFYSLNLQNEQDSEYKNDMIELMKSYGVFAVEIVDTYSDVEQISIKPEISRVDLISSVEAQKISARENKEILYICIPEKPDGTK